MALIGKFLLAIQRWCRDSYDKNEAFKNGSFANLRMPSRQIRSG